MNVTIPKPKWKLKSCPRCLKGDLFRENGYYECLQCGYIEQKTKPLPFTREKWHGKPTENGEPE